MTSKQNNISEPSIPPICNCPIPIIRHEPGQPELDEYGRVEWMNECECAICGYPDPDARAYGSHVHSSCLYVFHMDLYRIRRRRGFKFLLTLFAIVTTIMLI